MTAATELTTEKRTRSARAWQAWGVSLLLLVAAWGVTFVSSQVERPMAPFVVSATVGEEVKARGFAVTIHDVRAATYVTGSAPFNSRMQWYSEGNWLVVDATVVGTDHARPQLGSASLTIGDRRFRASERPASLSATGLEPGIRRSGSWAFELPPGVFESETARTAMLDLSLVNMPEADSVIRLPIDLTTLEVLDEAALVEPQWGAGNE